MSQSYRVVRLRWAAKHMRLIRWIRKPGEFVEHGEDLCEVEIDGEQRTLPFLYDDPPIKAGIYYTYVDEGEEVNPWGTLMEFSDLGVLRYRLHDTPGPRRFRYERRPKYPRIFLNYRRDDTAAYAGRLHERLSREFGSDEVFMDLFGILPGEVFSTTVQQVAAHCSVMVALVGPAWLKIQDGGGRRKLDSEHDFVRREITAAMDRQIPLIPLLAPGGVVPERRDLPEEMDGFEQLQMLELTHRHWIDDVELIIGRIHEILGTTTE